MESLVNCDFLDELEPSTALHPKHPLEKAMGRLLVEKCGKMRTPYYGVLLAKGDNPEEVKMKRLEMFNEVKKTLELMENELKKKGTTFFSGGSVGMTDLMVWPWIERLTTAYRVLFPGENLDIPKEMISLLAWIKNMWEVPAIKAYGLKGDNHAKFYAQAASENCDYDMLLTKGA
eukprot:GFUD01113399.1.p1 GENE.GFUD01113399.1~~GFUD01113399.1.p1  ORF type:complete len:185 (+),score=49.36 GFUD01113399.1:32-556(+)